MCLIGDILNLRDPRQKTLTTNYIVLLSLWVEDLDLGGMNLSDSEGIGADEVLREEVN